VAVSDATLCDHDATCGWRFRRARSESASHLKASARSSAPDHTYYRSIKQRHDGKLAALAVAPKLARRCYHTLRNVDAEEVYATV
jgi:hypothetical protein